MEERDREMIMPVWLDTCLVLGALSYAMLVPVLSAYCQQQAQKLVEAPQGPALVLL